MKKAHTINRSAQFTLAHADHPFEHHRSWAFAVPVIRGKYST